MKTLLIAAALVVAATAAEGAIVTRTVEYRQGETLLEGYLAYDDAVTGKRPGILVVHEWTGLGPYVKRRAEELARLGYVAFAADIYGKGVRPKGSDAAGREAGKYKGDRVLLRKRVRAGLQQLQGDPRVDQARIAAIGYCFGGTTVLELARSGAEIAGVVSFHGGLDSPTPEDGKKIRTRVLALHGADDPYVPAEQVKAFQDEMRTGKVDWQMVYYGGAVHSFTNPEAGSDNSKGAAYNARADRRSWGAMRQFFAEIFGGGVDH